MSTYAFVSELKPTILPIKIKKEGRMFLLFDLISNSIINSFEEPYNLGKTNDMGFKLN